MSMNQEKDMDKKSLPFFGIGKVIPFVKKYRVMITVMILCGLMSTGIDLLIPQFQRYAMNHFIGEGTLDTLPVFIGIYVITLLIMGCVNYISCTYAMKTEVSVNRDLRNAAFNHLQTLSFSYFNQNAVGYIHSRVMSDTGLIGEILSWGLMNMVWSGAYIIFVIAVMLATNVRLTLYVLLVLPVAALLMAFFQKKLLHFNRLIREINSRITGNYNEGITGAKTIKTLTVEQKMIDGFNEETHRMRRRSIQEVHYKALFSSTITFLSSVVLALVLWQGGMLTAKNLMLLGTLSVFMTYALEMLEPIQNIIDIIAMAIGIQVNIERFTKLLAEEADVADSPEVVEKYGDMFHPKKENWEPLHGDVEFDDVTFTYPDGEEEVLSHFNLKVKNGTNVAIVGETGAGKSTLVNLVCRFYEPTKGRVLIDGRDARERSTLWLHSNIGYVLQTPHLFSGSVRDNLRYGKPDATDEEIMQALRLVSAEEVLSKMDKGLDSDVGEGGDLLSTGEKQLLSFARAILADPRILVLDEATSSIDTVTEKAIQNAIQVVTKGRTSFVIAHRLSTVVDADVILVVKDGKIIDQGTHKELMHRKGYYYELYTRQYEELAWEA